VLSDVGTVLRAWGEIHANCELRARRPAWTRVQIPSGLKAVAWSPTVDRMKQLTLVLLFAIGASAFSGCIIDRRPHRTVVHKEKRGCGPAHHWDGERCVHNGKGKHKGHR